MKKSGPSPPRGRGGRRVSTPFTRSLSTSPSSTATRLIPLMVKGVATAAMLKLRAMLVRCLSQKLDLERIVCLPVDSCTFTEGVGWQCSNPAYDSSRDWVSILFEGMITPGAFSGIQRTGRSMRIVQRQVVHDRDPLERRTYVMLALVDNQRFLDKQERVRLVKREAKAEAASALAAAATTTTPSRGDEGQSPTSPPRREEGVRIRLPFAVQNEEMWYPSMCLRDCVEAWTNEIASRVWFYDKNPRPHHHSYAPITTVLVHVERGTVVEDAEGDGVFRVFRWSCICFGPRPPPPSSRRLQAGALSTSVPNLKTAFSWESTRVNKK